IYFTTPSVTDKLAEVVINHTLQNDSLYPVNVTVVNELLYGEDMVLKLKQTGYLEAGGQILLQSNGSLEQPLLWSPEHPHRYRLLTIITAENDEHSFHCRMETEQQVGIRSIHFDPDHGFFLNEQPYKLKGVCVHHDAGCLGAAVPSQVWHRRLEALKSMGCNALRMSHNPHMPELYDLCDTLGFFVMDEAFDEWEGPKNKWSTGHNVYPPKHQGYYEDFPQWHERDLSDFIKRDRNHPSIIAWSIGNEIDYPNDPYCHPFFQNMEGNNDKNKPVNEQMYNPDRPNAARLSVLATQLVKIVKQHDLTRPVTSAVSFPELSSRIGFYAPLDIVGYNYKEQFYAKDHLLFPDKPFLGSENSHSYLAWKAVRDQEYISGQFLWTGIDYLGEARGWPIHGSGAGLLTLAGYEKTSYYRRMSFWSSTPMLYLSTARAELSNSSTLDIGRNREWKSMYRSWNYIPGEMVEIRCYTNLPSAELFCNGRSFGTKEYNDELGYIDWLLPYEPGELTVTGIHQSEDNKEICDTLSTVGRSCNIVLHRWKPSEEVLEIPEEDALIQIEATITDDQNRWISNDSSLLRVTVTGAGLLAGIENGDLADNTEYTAFYRRAYEGRLIIYVTHTQPGMKLMVTVEGEGLKPAEYTI
ncbi:MAG: Beta-galactosidase BoGH2A, partial [Firmicutes bacterium]|nr:Beta-galactosidase BoGH2A [Bacillota bacterium]